MLPPEIFNMSHEREITAGSGAHQVAETTKEVATYMTSTFLQWGPLCVSFTSWMALGGMNLEWVAMHWQRSSVAILARALPVSGKGRGLSEEVSTSPRLCGTVLG